MRARDPKLQAAIRKRAKEGDIYCRLVLAEHDNRGIRLSAEDVGKLVRMDDAIETAAEAWAEELLDEADLPP
jgi:hypothetical protein